MGLFRSAPASQRPLSRSIGNAQARNPALPGMPAYGNTTNPNGAQTAVQSPMIAPPQQVFGAVRQIEQNQLQSMPATPAPAPYPGGDVPGLASFYRNRATQNYMPPSARIVPDAAGNSAQAGRIAGILPVGTSPSEISQFNGYDGNTQAFNDPTRLTPTQREFIARQSARTAGQMDPTGLSQRFGAGSALGQQAAGIAAGQAGVAAGTHVEVPGGYGNLPSYRSVDHQAEQQRLANLASSSPERAMDQSSTGTQFAYRGANGEIVSTNRLGQLQQMAQADPSNADIKIAIAQEKQRTSALGANQEAQRERRRAASSDGLTDKERRRLGNKTRDANRAAMAGIISPAERDARIARNTQLAQEQSDFRSSETKIRRSVLNAQNETEMNDAIRSDRTRDANGQLNSPVREAASTVLSRLADPTYKPTTPRVQEQQRHVQAYGLTPWSENAGGDSPAAVSEKAMSKGIMNYKQAEALHRYWNAQKDSDSAWIGISGPNPQIALLDEMASVPKEKLNDWFEKNKGRLLELKSQYENNKYNNNMPFQMFN